MTGFEVVNFGCRLNAHEAEMIKAMGEAEGLDRTVVFNTCAVTAEAQRQARQAIRRGADRPGILCEARGGRPGDRQCREIGGDDLAEAEARPPR
jgi:uncharacterized protein UPF0004